MRNFDFKALDVPNPEQALAYLAHVNTAAVPHFAPQAAALALPAGVDWKAMLLALLAGLMSAQGGAAGKPGELPVPPAPPAPPTPPPGEKVEPPEPPEVEEPEADGQIIDAFHDTKIVDMLNPDQSKAATGQEMMAGTATQGMVNTAKGPRGQRVRFDTTPSLRGRKYVGNDPFLNGPAGYGRGGNPSAPKIQARWWVNGVERSNSGNDAFHLGSYEDNGGTTPTLKLEAPVGPGRNKCELQFFIAAEDNGGVRVEGQKVGWFCD